MFEDVSSSLINYVPNNVGHSQNTVTYLFTYLAMYLHELFESNKNHGFWLDTSEVHFL